MAPPNVTCRYCRAACRSAEELARSDLRAGVRVTVCNRCGGYSNCRVCGAYGEHDDTDGVCSECMDKLPARVPDTSQLEK